MEPYELYDLWAPADALWSPWAKPVLFASMPAEFLIAAQTGAALGAVGLDVSWAPPPDGSTAIILDLPGEKAVPVALALGQRGYRPVPLYNTTLAARAILPLEGLMRAVAGATATLTSLRLPPEAPPVFLLDSRRRHGEHLVAPGMYDNRWLAFPQDFPSAVFLLSHGIQNVVLCTEERAPAEDLAHVLLRWQEAGVRIWQQQASANAAAEPILVKRPPSYRSFLYRALVMMGLRRNSAGGFGALVPMPSSG